MCARTEGHAGESARKATSCISSFTRPRGRARGTFANSSTPSVVEAIEPDEPSGKPINTISYTIDGMSLDQSLRMIRELWSIGN